MSKSKGGIIETSSYLVIIPESALFYINLCKLSKTKAFLNFSLSMFIFHASSFGNHLTGSNYNYS